MQKVLDEIKQERQRQNQKWGVQSHNLVEWMAILTEEVGEASKEAVDYHFKNLADGGFAGMIAPNEATQKRRLGRFRKELIQVAAVAVQIIEDLDNNNN